MRVEVFYLENVDEIDFFVFSVAWLIGWALVLEYTIGGAAVARGITPNLVWCPFNSSVEFLLALEYVYYIYSPTLTF